MLPNHITPTAAEAIRLKQADFEPVQLPPKSKAPNRKGWPDERLSLEEIPAKFANGENLGVLTGKPSKGLTDVDVDAAVGWALATADGEAVAEEGASASPLHAASSRAASEAANASASFEVTAGS